MNDTIELLNAIGQDASMRHASAEELIEILQRTDASEALMAAVGGDDSALSRELGHKPTYVPQTQIPGHEEHDPDHDKGKPHQPPKPGPGHEPDDHQTPRD
jgi:hypothetical protein